MTGTGTLKGPLVSAAHAVELTPLRRDDIELVRAWRNDPQVSQYMEYRQEISAEQQQRWFASIDNDCNYYYLIVADGQKIGLANLKDVDRLGGVAEAGIFIADEKYLNGWRAFVVSLLLTDFAFERLNLLKLHCRILRDNPRAIRFNLTLGYILEPGQAQGQNQLYVLTPESYRKAAARIRKVLR